MTIDHNIGKSHSLTSGDACEHANFYKSEASDYDERYGAGGWLCPSKVAQTAKIHLPLTSTVADVGCGTGLAGEELKKQGYLNIDGYDISPDMLEKAKEKNIYNKTFKHDIYTDALLKTYDGIIISGAITLGHLDARVFPNLVESIVVGGYLIFSAPCTHEYDTNYVGSNASKKNFLKDSGILDWLDASNKLDIVNITADYQSMSFNDQVLYHRNYICRRSM